tara:strand:- start:976 stop:1545 length:570 start_codon:yes stop_codon:yes gene_type:complete
VIYNQNNRLTNFLKEKEGFRPEPYLDQAGLPTIGYGTRFYEDGTEVTMDDPAIDETRATNLMNGYVNQVAQTLTQMPGFNQLNPNQKDAIISFGYNFGANFYNDKDNFGIISGAIEKGDNKAITEAFPLYVNVADDKDPRGYSKSQGLVNRRNAEVDLFNEAYKITNKKPTSVYDAYVKQKTDEELDLD